MAVMIEFCYKFLLLLGVLFFDFAGHIILNDYIPRIDLLVLCLKYPGGFSGVFILFIIGLLRDIIYVLPLGTNSITYGILFLIVYKEGKEKDGFIDNRLLRVFKLFFLSILTSLVIQWTMSSLFFRELLPLDRMASKFLCALIFYMLIYVFSLKIFKRSKFLRM